MWGRLAASWAGRMGREKSDSQVSYLGNRSAADTWKIRASESSWQVLREYVKRWEKL